MSIVTPNPAPVVPAINGGVIPTHFRQYTDVTSFTYRTGMSHMALVENMRVWIQKTLIPYLNDEFGEMESSWEIQVNNLITAIGSIIETQRLNVNDALTAQSADVAEQLSSTLTEIVAGADGQLNDGLVLSALESANSTALAFLDGRYVNTAEADGTVNTLINNPDSAVRGSLNSLFLSGETDADPIVKAAVTDAGSQTRGALDGLYLHDSAEVMQGKALFVAGDSFTQPINGQTPAVDQVTADHTMTATNVGVSSSFARDVAMRLVQTNPTVPSNGFVVLQEGINMVVRHQADPLYRKSEYAAIQASILLACMESKLDTNAAVGTGTWVDYPNTKLSGGAGRSSQTVGSKYTWAAPAFGYYFGLGYTFQSGAGAAGNTGKWSAGTTQVMAARGDAPGPTALETDDPPYSASNFVPWPVLIPVLSGAQQVQVEVVNTNFCIVDALYKLRDAPPMVAVVLPTRVTGTTYPVTEQDLQVIRGDFRRAVAELVNFYPALKGRVVLVDPHEFGWDAAVHTVADGLHPNTAGHRVIATAIEKTVSRVTLLAPLMTAWGAAGVGVNYPLDWLNL
jgi:hypothetical protein